MFFIGSERRDECIDFTILCVRFCILYRIWNNNAPNFNYKYFVNYFVFLIFFFFLVGKGQK